MTVTEELSRSGDPGPVDLGDGVFQLPTDYPEVCNAPLWTYLLLDGDKFALIDPGIRSTMGATLEGSVRQLGLGLDALDLLLATHGHPDHSGGQSSWGVEAPAARIAAPLEDAPWVESFDRQWTRFWDDYPGTLDLSSSREFLAGLCVPEPTVDVLLRDGDSVAIGDRALDVVETRGHTWGHCAYFDRRSSTLFTGDAVQGRGIASCDGETVFAPLYVDVAEARWGLRRLQALPFERLCPAHVPPMTRDEGLRFLQASLDFIDEVDALAREMVSERSPAPLLTSELAIRISDLTGTDPPLTPQTVPTARAHLYALAREGLLDAAWIPRTIEARDG
ncbi:MAG: beta-lactamase domain protein [Acidimicrobiaceae bacterium]|nr:beta-lactamase domain protein [Acidimicrobiaceae bacterium]